MNRTEEPRNRQDEGCHANNPTDFIRGNGQDALGFVVGTHAIIIGIVVHIKWHAASKGGCDFFISLDGTGVFDEDNRSEFCISNVNDVGGLPTALSDDIQFTHRLRKQFVSSSLDSNGNVSVGSQ